MSREFVHSRGASPASAFGGVTQNHHMKAQFKFSPGQTVVGTSGFPGRIVLCCVGADGNQYLLRTQVGDLVELEADLKNFTKPE